MEIPEVDLDGLDRIVREGQVVVADFWSPWCAPCRSMRPHLERLASERRDDTRFVAVNVEREQQAAERFGVETLPTFILFKDGEPVDRLSGPTLPAEVAKRLEAQLVA